jgi:hypothetical protein
VVSSWWFRFSFHLNVILEDQLSRVWDGWDGSTISLGVHLGHLARLMITAGVDGLVRAWRFEP